MAQGGPYIDPRGIPDMPMGQPALEDPMGSNVGLAGAKSPVVPAGPDQNQLSNETVDALAAPRSGSGPRLSMDGGGYAWAVGADDFNPNGFKPNESRSTQVGKYGGAPLFAATLGMPTGAVASALQRNAQRQDEIRKAVQQFDPMAGVEDVNAPEYRDSFQRGAMDDIHGYVASVNEQWGDQEGYRRMITAGTPEYRGLRERASAWTTVARKMNQSTGSAAALIEGYDKGTLQVPRSLRDDAEELLRKTGEWSGNQDPTELANLMTVFTANVSLVDQLKTDGISAVLKNSGSVQKFYDEIKKGYKGPNGETLYHPAYRTILGRKTESYDDAIKGIADSYVEQYKGVLSEEEILKTVRAFAPEIKYEEDVMTDERSLPSSSSSGGGASGDTAKAGALDISMSKMPAALFTGKVNPNTGKGAGPGVDKEYPTITLFDVVSGQGRTPVAREFIDPTTTEPVFMHPTRIMDINGKLFIVGKVTGQQRTTNQAAGGSGGGSGAFGATAEEPISVDEFNVLKDKIIPYKGNETIVKQSFPWLTDEGVKSAFRQNKSAPKQEGMVTVRMPDGKTGSIPSGKVEEFKKKYPGASVVN